MDPIHIFGIFGLFTLLFIFNVIRMFKKVSGKLEEAGLNATDVAAQVIHQAKNK